MELGEIMTHRARSGVGLVIIAIIVILVFIVLNLLWARDNVPGSSAIVTSDTAPLIAEQPTNLPPPILDAATTTATAERAKVQIPVSEPPAPPTTVFDPVAYVNGLEYRAGQPESAMEAYRVVATYYGWSDVQIYARAQFVQRIMAGESAFCWNARRWTYFTTGKLCHEHKTGVHDDVGFGQITNVLRPLTCEKVQICNIAQTVASPWNSMLAYVAVLTELKSRPWCYRDDSGRPNTHMRNGDCATWPG